jgi:hypothetical protein
MSTIFSLSAQRIFKSLSKRRRLRVYFDIKAPSRFYWERFGFHRREYVDDTGSRRHPVDYLNQIDVSRGDRRM